MPVTVDQFLESLSHAGLLSSKDLRSFESLDATERGIDAGEFAARLVNDNKLTELQALAVYDGKASRLMFGEYVISEKIGHGAMGQVYKAYHRRLGRPVALNLLRSSRKHSWMAQRRFRREVQACIQLEHPNVISTYDAGEAHGHLYLVMQFVEGMDLVEYLKKFHPVPVPEALNLTLQIANGLRYVHQSQLIHRDIKPNNLLIDAHGVIRILDMGLIRWSDRKRTDGKHRGRLTGPGQFLGTLQFMAPEQASNPALTDQRANIYSLGITLYYLLTGQVPYADEIISEVLLTNHDVPTPSLCMQRDDVPMALDAIFQKMIARKADYRFSSMDDVIKAIDELRLASSRVSVPVNQSMVTYQASFSELPKRLKSISDCSDFEIEKELESPRNRDTNDETELGEFAKPLELESVDCEVAEQMQIPTAVASPTYETVPQTLDFEEIPATSSSWLPLVYVGGGVIGVIALAAAAMTLF